MFIGIFGIESKKKTLMEIAPVVCPDHGMTRAVLYECFTFFHFFFIPLFKWNRQYLLELRCGCIYALSKEQAETVKKDGTVDFSGLTKMYTGGSAAYKHCGTCNKNFDDSYRYCPFCGSELK